MRKILSTLLLCLCALGSVFAADEFNITDFSGVVPTGTEVVTIDGKKYWKVSPDAWNTSFPIALETGTNNKFSFDAKLEAGTYAGDITKLNVFVKLTAEGSEASVGKPATTDFSSYKSDIKTGTTFTNIQLAFQENVKWDAVSGAILYISPITLSEEAVAAVEPPVTIYVPKATTAIEIDGIPDDAWDIAIENEVKNVATGTVASADDNSGVFKALWDETNLYILVDITDDDPYEYGAATKAWENDGIEMFVDIKDRRFVEGARITTEQHQLRVNYMRKDEEGNFIADQDGLGENTMTIAQVPGGSGYTFEIAIPFAGIAYGTDFDLTTLGDGSKIAFELSILDANQLDVRKSILNWSNNTGTDVAYNINQYYGRMILSSGTAVNNLHADKLKVYPTISSSSIHVNMEGLGSIEVVDIAGKVVLKQVVNANQAQLNVSNIKTGVYFVKAYSKQSLATAKVIIK